MKKLAYYLFVSFFLIFANSFIGKAQTTYQFTYDNAGNRESRTVILLKSASISDTLQAKQAKKPLEDFIGDQEIKIYPNPTKGLLRVQIPSPDLGQVTIHIFNLKGALLRKTRVTDENTEVNLSDQPSGMYVLRIAIGDQTSEWKIIKD
jgi:hypothetical protein